MQIAGFRGAQESFNQPIPEFALKPLQVRIGKRGFTVVPDSIFRYDRSMGFAIEFVDLHQFSPDSYGEDIVCLPQHDSGVFCAEVVIFANQDAVGSTAGWTNEDLREHAKTAINAE
jgi:hypothetical protein